MTNLTTKQTDKTVSACKEGHKEDCDMLSNVGIPKSQKDESYCTCNPPTETVSDLQRDILVKWYNNGGNGEYSPVECSYSYHGLENVTGIDESILRKEMPALRKLGYVEFTRGLLDEEGFAAGAGHCLHYEKIKEIKEMATPNPPTEPTVEPIKLPPLPRSVTGLKKDGTKDKRYTTGTYANLRNWMEEASGVSDYQTKVEPTVEKWEIEFDKKFVQSNDPKDNGILYLYRVNPDGSLSIALPKNIKDFIRHSVQEAKAEMVEKVSEEIQRVEPLEFFNGRWLGGYTTAKSQILNRLDDLLTSLRKPELTDQEGRER